MLDVKLDFAVNPNLICLLQIDIQCNMSSPKYPMFGRRYYYVTVGTERVVWSCRLLTAEKPLQGILSRPSRLEAKIKQRQRFCCDISLVSSAKRTIFLVSQWWCDWSWPTQRIVERPAPIFCIIDRLDVQIRQKGMQGNPHSLCHIGLFTRSDAYLWLWRVVDSIDKHRLDCHTACVFRWDRERERERRWGRDTPQVHPIIELIGFLFLSHFGVS